MVYKLSGGSSSQFASRLRSYSNMNYHQLAKLVLVLSCIGSDVLAGLLPEGGTGGYQYNRPGGGFVGSGGGGFASDTGFSGSGHGGDFGVGSYKVGRPTQAYGPPGGSGDTFGRSGTGGGTFGGQQSSNRYPQFGEGGGGYQDGGTGGYQGGFGYGRDNGRPRPYSFHYEVIDLPSGNDYSQRESSDGNVVQGEYRVLLPDSRTQIVRYMADDINGYNADVQYEGQAQFPQGGGPGYQGGGYGGGAGGYQAGRGGPGGGFGGGSFGSGGFGGGDGASNQYLPPRSGYRK